MFALSFEEDEVSYAPTHCPFCGDFYDNENEELDFNDNDDDDKFESLEDDLNDDDEDDRRWN
jgi:hypothetical protein